MQSLRRIENIVSLSSIGKSSEGHDIWVAKISDDAGADEPGVLFVGGHHAREHLTVEMTLYILHLLVDKYGSDQTITDLVNSREIYIVFNLNPDGSEYDIATPNLYQNWQKNRQDNPGWGYIGADLNRNYGYKWNNGDPSGGPPWSAYYRGASAFSAPETAALASFINGHAIGGKQQITTAISFHSYGEWILWPYGYTYDDVPAGMAQDDHDVFVAMAQAMASTNGYGTRQLSDVYYTSDGDMTDWAYGVHRIFAYTFELYPNSENPGYYPPGGDIVAATSINKDAVLYIIGQADCPYRATGKAGGLLRLGEPGARRPPPT